MALLVVQRYLLINALWVPKSTDQVVTWGDADGGDSSAVQDRLVNVQQIQATYRAFAAILGRRICGDLGRS